MTVTDIGNELYLELSEPSDTSLAAIVKKLRHTIGDLNNLLNTSFILNGSYEIVDNGTEITTDQASILKKLFLISYYTKQSRTYLGANGVDSIVEVTSDGSRYRTVDRNQISKSYIELKKLEQAELKTLLNNYKFNKSTAKHVVGDDYISKYDVVDPE